MRLFIRPAAVMLLAAGSIWAHHGSAGFDRNKPVHFTGTVSSVDWTNPHVVIHLEVTGNDGNVATWLVNTLPPNTSTRRGFPKSSFGAGMEITVDGYRAIDGSNHVNGTNIIFKNGEKIVIADCFDNGPNCYKPR